MGFLKFFVCGKRWGFFFKLNVGIGIVHNKYICTPKTAVMALFWSLGRANKNKGWVWGNVFECWKYITHIRTPHGKELRGSNVAESHLPLPACLGSVDEMRAHVFGCNLSRTRKCTHVCEQHTVQGDQFVFRLKLSR